MSVASRQIDEAIVDLARVDYVDLWAITRLLKSEFGDALVGDPADIALEAVERLLRDKTLRAGDLVPPGEFEPWTDDAERSIRAIRDRAASVGHTPDVGDVGWFDLAE